MAHGAFEGPLLLGPHSGTVPSDHTLRCQERAGDHAHAEGCLSACVPLPLGLVAQISQDPPTQRKGDPMLRQFGKMVGVALAMLCLVSTLAGAVEMTCRASDGKGNCTAGSGPDGKEVVVVGTGIAVGEKMDCIDKGTLIECTKKQ
jgi:hypothetical protein